MRLITFVSPSSAKAPTKAIPAPMNRTRKRFWPLDQNTSVPEPVTVVPADCCKWRYNRVSLYPPPACIHGQSPWGFDRRPESSAFSACTPSPAADRLGTGPSCVFPQSGGLAPVAPSPADQNHLAACTFL